MSKINKRQANEQVVLITGGAGYIGSQLIRDLIEEPLLNGSVIRIYDNMQRNNYFGLMDLPENGRYEFIHGDILDRMNLERAMQNVSVVIHLAAIVHTPLSFEHPEWTAQINHWGTAAVVDCAITAGVPRLIYASSASVYGPGGPFKETDVCRPVGPYAISKHKGEKEVIDAGKRGLFTTIVRLGTVFGNAPAMRFEAVTSRLCYLVGIRRPMVIHGSGEQVRPLIHIKDASTILSMCLTEFDSEDIINAVIVNPSVNQIAQTLQRIVPGAKIQYTDQDILTEISYVIDSTKLTNLGFQAQFDLEQGLKEMLTRWRGFQPTPQTQVLI